METASIRAAIALVLAAFVSACEPADVPLASAPAQVLRALPHDPGAFTQGLFIRDGRLFESTGRVGQSTLREVDLQTGRVVRAAVVPNGYFGEGSTDWGDQVVSLTWQDGVVLRWRRSDFAPLASTRIKGEGWGLANDGASLILSDGTPELRFLDPVTLAERRRIRVTADGVDVDDLNELEFVRGEILANIWQQSLIARIDPASGKVIGWIDCAAIVRGIGLSDGDSVLNGIAYDAKANRLFITGKNWPALYEIAVPAKS